MTQDKKRGKIKTMKAWAILNGKSIMHSVENVGQFEIFNTRREADTWLIDSDPVPVTISYQLTKK